MAQNPIVTENALQGNPPSEWDITGAGSSTIQGFATDISINKGETVHFKINTNATAYTIDIYRLGYYNGDGARKAGNGVVTATLPQLQPAPLENTAVGLVDCGNWNESAHWDVPSTAVSGVYIAKLIRTDNNEASHIIFIVRDDASTADLFFQTSDATWQAYNVYGGNSLYVGSTSFPAGHAAKVSYNRPFITRAGGGGGGIAQDWIFNAEFPMIRFLEKNGYNISYTTNIDAARRGTLILNHKVFLSVGHDEYWSAEQRASVEAARNAGVHLAFFSGNEVYWKTRWENSIDAGGTAYRTLVCYKEGTLGESVCGGKCDPSPVWTGLWRDGCSFPGGGGCLPENALTGQISWTGSTSSIRVPSQYKNLRFWRNTSITSLTPEAEAVFANGTLGYEWDWEQYPASYPSGRITLSQTLLSGRTHKMSMYRHSSGAWVFGAGTVQWAWGLDSVHDNGNHAADPRMQQATVNLFADMGVQPAILQAGLVAATASTDVTAPHLLISSPVNGANIVGGTPTTISGTATDAGGVVAGVEISIDGGTTWKAANGSASWNYSFTPSVLGPVIIKVRAFDDSGNKSAEETITVNVVNAICPCTIFNTSNVPANTNVFDNQGGMEMGVRFKTTSDGYITGLRFYKGTSDAGQHTGTLWSATGNLLGQATFVNETASGWQQVLFSTPVHVTSGTTYIASYFSPTGFYSQTSQYFTAEIFNAPLIAFENTTATINGLFRYTNAPAFPTGSFDATNYWVDVVFDTTLAADVAPPVVLSTFPASNETAVEINADPKAFFNEFIDPTSLTTANFELRGPGNALVPSTVTAMQAQAVLNPVSLLNRSTVYTVTIKGGAGGVKDLAGNPLAADYSWSFTTADPPPLPPVDGPGGPILVIASANTNPFSTYTSEILRTEGLNEFAVKEIADVNATLLNSYDVVILGEVVITPAQAALFTSWVNAGGTLIAFKPSTQLSSLLGITKQTGTLAEGYIRVNTTAGTPGAGIVGETIQYHGVSDIYTLNGATSLATLYSNASTATANPAVTTRNVGSGKAVAFTYDLNKSIIYTRQGNPEWAGQERDNEEGPIRPNDLFFGGASDPNWNDFNKIAIPQADEQQRLLVNIILQSNMHKKPLPRFWFLPSDHKAAIVMTGDDHNLDGTVGQFNHFKTLGPNTPQDVADWKAIRGTSYVYVGTMTDADVAGFQEDGFEISLHANTSCQNFTPATFENYLSTQLNILHAQLPSLNTCLTHRTHCVTWSDWATAAKLEAQYGMRLDANYYYWPGTWIQDRPGMFTGSGMPMRFADLDGSMIDCYQLTTQMSDEANINYSLHANSLLDKALGPEGYYGVFCVNMHTDLSDHPGANAIIAAALAHHVPVISAKQMLTWLDGRNGSSFGNITWNANQLSFSITALAAAHNMRAMVPYNSDGGQLAALTRNGNAVTFATQNIKGMQYAFFDAQNGNYVATYGTVSTGSLTGSIVMQGVPAPPDAQQAVTVRVDLYDPANTATPLQSYTVTTNTNGVFTINNIPTGTYTIAVKHVHTLQNVKTGQLLVGGSNTVNFGTLFNGDINNDNFISAIDLGALLSSYNKGVGDPGFVPNADLNGDGFVTAIDLGIVLFNYNKLGQSP